MKPNDSVTSMLKCKRWITFFLLVVIGIGGSVWWSQGDGASPGTPINRRVQGSEDDRDEMPSGAVSAAREKARWRPTKRGPKGQDEPSPSKPLEKKDMVEQMRSISKRPNPALRDVEQQLIKIRAELETAETDEEKERLKRHLGVVEQMRIRLQRAPAHIP